MTPNMTTQPNCGLVIEKLDAYLNYDFKSAAGDEFTRHIEQCDTCREELINRKALRDRLRSAVRGVEIPSDLRQRISHSLDRPSMQGSRSWPRWAMVVAAALALTVGGAVSYQLGHLRITAASRESYLSQISSRVSGIMRVGLGDHVHCAVFRKYPTAPPPPETIAADMGPEYLGLVDIVRQHIPANQKIVMAHRCSYHRRKFVHISFVDGQHLASIVIALRQPGENFDSSELAPALSAQSLPVYQSKIQRFQIDGFQTNQYLVYLVSDLPDYVNNQVMAQLAKPVQQFLMHLES
jgi:hypothetical protein